MIDKLITISEIVLLLCLFSFIPWALYMAVSTSRVERATYFQTCEQIGGKAVWNGKFYECFTKGQR